MAAQTRGWWGVVDSGSILKVEPTGFLMDWLWAVRKREEAASPPRFGPEQWRDRIAIDWKGQLAFQQHCFCLLFIIPHPERAFLDFFSAVIVYEILIPEFKL